MSSKTKNKAKKKAKPVADVAKKDSPNNKKILSYFSNEEIAEIKAVTKTKDAGGVPYIIAATFLHKFDLIKALLEEGHNVNQTGQNNMTALMWAVKYKFLDIIDFLLNNGADPTIKTDSGDNILILALENKLWDEAAMINLWKAVKKISFIDVNFANKNGHNMLHMCVRRDWEELLQLLLIEKPNVNAANCNGVTPLMLACFRNNINITDILIKSGADIMKEDNHERMPLCYAISSSVKSGKPFETTDRLVKELQKKNMLESYIKSRLDLVVATSKKSEITVSASELLLKILQFIIQHVEEGVVVLLQSNFFNTIFEDNTPRTNVKFLIEICAEILFYNEQVAGYKPELYEKLLDDFFHCSAVDFVLEVLRSCSEISRLAFDVLILAHKDGKEWEKILEENSNVILSYLTEMSCIQDETKSKILKTKKRRIKKIFENLDIVPSENLPKRTDSNSSKKSRRRSKAIKAKITKIKSAELCKRLNFASKNKFPPKVRLSNSVEFLLKPKDSLANNPIVASFQHLLHKTISVDSFDIDDNAPAWKKQIMKMANVDECCCPVNYEKLASCMAFLRKCHRYDVGINRSIGVVLDYLKELVKIIVAKYREHWEHDKIPGRCNCYDVHEHVPWLFHHHLKSLETKERKTILNLQRSIDQLLKSLKELSRKDLSKCLKAITVLETTLLSHEIRGIKLMSYVCSMETFKMRYSASDPKQTEETIVRYVQNVVNDFEDVRSDIEIEIVEDVDDVSFTETYRSETPFELYCKEMETVAEPAARNKRKEIEAKLNTIANGFHLINSIMGLCDDTGRKKLYSISDLNYPPMRCAPKMAAYTEISEYMPRRLKSQIASLQAVKTYQVLLGGDIRIATKEQRPNYIVSAGINFSAVELGLATNDQPLAIKRIPKEGWVGKIVKTLVEPLVGLMGTHILHYFACDYDQNELILATPLCKWTMAQYVHLMRHSSPTTMPGLTTMQLVRQFLDGLMFLHKCDGSIVHGNLKPSNVFVDFDGLVKIGEFGMHKALYKIIEAPKTSLIWFARETLEIYRNSSMVECSVRSDIQVAGMLTYFILSLGKHPFGDDPDEILKNLQRGTPQITCKNQDLRDLILWMLDDFSQRPAIEQVLGHPFFWSPSKKWSFVLCCSGINQNGYVLPLNVDKLHRSIDAFCDAYMQIEWHNLMRSKFHHVRIVENDSVVGLLKFIMHCFEFKTNLSEADLGCILSLFPALPVGLYRTLQNTNWLKHPVFVAFSELF